MNKFCASLILAASLLQTTASPGAMVAYYPLNETSGNVANDASGNARHATSTVAGGNNNWQSGGIIGGAVQFTPTAQADVDEAFVHLSGANITTTYPFSMSTWLKTSSSSTLNQTLLNISGNSASTSRYYSVLLSSATGNPLSGQARTVQNITTSSGTSVNDGQWHHAVWVLSANNSRTLYLDGVSVITDAQTVDVIPAADNPRKLGIGALIRSSSTANYTDSFSGMLDDVGFWTDSLTATDVALMHAFGRYDGVALNQSAIFTSAMNVFNTQSGTVDTGALDWAYATGLSGPRGTAGLSGGNPFVVLDAAGNGLRAIPEPSAAALAVLAAFSLTGRRRTVRPLR